MTEMFHLMIGLIGMGFVAASIGIVLIPLWLGPLMQAVIRIFARDSVVRAIPGILGILGTVASLYYFSAGSEARHII